LKIKTMTDSINDYFSDWQGWYCEVSTLDDGTIITDSEDSRYDEGEVCSEVIENTTKELTRHLKEKHGLNVRFD